MIHLLVILFAVCWAAIISMLRRPKWKIPRVVLKPAVTINARNQFVFGPNEVWEVDAEGNWTVLTRKNS